LGVGRFAPGVLKFGHYDRADQTAQHSGKHASAQVPRVLYTVFSASAVNKKPHGLPLALRCS
jgi:hypothetical protein